MTVATQQRERMRCGQRIKNAPTPAFVRKVAKAGRYAIGKVRELGNEIEQLLQQAVAPKLRLCPPTE